MSDTCKHGHFARVCEMCDRDKTIADLREAVRVLAASVRSNAKDRAVCPHWDEEVCTEVLANPIAAEAVRKAGG